MQIPALTFHYNLLLLVSIACGVV